MPGYVVYFLSVFLSLVIGTVCFGLLRKGGLKFYSPRANRVFSFTNSLGRVECYIYCFAVIFSFYNAIGAWLAFKALLKHNDMKEIHLYAIGTGINLVLCVLCSVMTMYVLQYNTPLVQQVFFSPSL